MGVKDIYLVIEATDNNTITQLKQFIKTYHYSHSVPGIKAIFGLYDTRNKKRKLIGAMAYSHPTNRYNDDGHTLELIRLVLVDDTLKNAESYFIAKTLKFLSRSFPEIRRVISYADSAYGHTGVIYKASNFKYIGTSKPGGGTYIINGKKQHSRHIFRGMTNRSYQGLVELYGEENVVKVPRSVKHLYEYILDK